MIPATGVRPPLLIFAIVRAIAPVAGIPPKKGTTTLAIPLPINSVLELCLSPITPSATIAESNDSIAPNIAMVNAAGRTACAVEKNVSPSAKAGILNEGRPEGNSYKSPIVLIESTPAYFFKIHVTTVIMMIANNEPGIFFEILGVNAIIKMLSIPINNAHQLIFERFWK